MLEIGSDLGLLVESIRINRIFAVDPIRNYKIPFKFRHIKFFEMTSDEFFEKHISQKYDFIFVDGLHTYEQVLKDCQNYYPKLKPGGLISGHDYKVIENVRKAVDEFANSVNKTVNLIDEKYQADVWYWTK
jgi:predicted O-methyltransferase YrrM